MTGGAVRAAFAEQALACADMGSPLTARVLRLLGQALSPGALVDDLVLKWPGDPSPFADSVPLRLAGGLHALILSGQDPSLADAYTHADALDDPTFCAALQGAMARHSSFLTRWMQSPPQTNEVRRSAILIAAGHWLDRHFGLPLVLSELGASAGLNLIWDRYALTAGQVRLGPRDAVLDLSPDWRGTAPVTGAPQVAHRAGVDLNPLDPVADRLRLMAYVWADQTDRLDRTARAATEAARMSAPITRADAGDWLDQRLRQPFNKQLHLIFHTVAWQYFPQATRDRARAAIHAAGARATETAPLALLGMEADSADPGAGLTLRLWPEDRSIDLGRADFHGRWIDWRAPAP